MTKCIKVFLLVVFSWLSSSVVLAQSSDVYTSPEQIDLLDIQTMGETSGGSFIFNLIDTKADMSYTFLSVLFGPIVGSGSLNKITGEVFRIFNLGVLSVLGIIIGYTVIMSVIGSSQDGSGAFSTRVSPWVLTRTVGGASLMVPLGNGYCALQILVMKVVLMGVGFANTAWVTVVNLSEQGTTLAVDSTYEVQTARLENEKANIEAMNNAYKNIYLSELDQYAQCLQSQTKKNTLKHGSFLPSAAPGVAKFECKDTTVHELDQEKNNVRFQLEHSTRKKAFIDHIRASFDSFMLIQSNYQDNPPKSESELSNEWVGKDIDIKKVFIDKFFSNENRLHKSIVQQIYQRAYDMSQIYKFTKKLPDIDAETETPSWHLEAKRKGWLSSGMYYRKLTGASTAPPKSGLSPINVVEPLSFSGSNSVEEFSKEFDSFKAEQGGYSKQLIIDINATKAMIVSDTVVVPSKYLNNLVRMRDNINMVSKYTYKSTEAFELIPPISGKLAGKTSWMWGIDVTMPIQFLARMSISSAQAIMGVDILGDHLVSFAHIDPNLFLTEYKVPNTQVTGLLETNKSRKLFNAINIAIINATDIDIASILNGDGGMLSSFKPEFIDPLEACEKIGRKLIEYSTDYFKNTLTTLYAEMEKMAWAYYGSTTGPSLAADIAAAAPYGTAGAPVGTAAKIAAAITVNGLKMAYGGTRTALEMYIPIGTAIAGTLLTMGIIMSVYIPMLPFLLFLFGAVGWLMSVVEAIVAAPLVALGMTHPEGHDLLGKSEQALILLLGVFIRPITLLFGILIAIVVAQVVFKLFNMSFAFVAISLYATQVEQESSMVVLGMISAGIILVYVYAMLSVIEQSYSLIYQVPDRILRWIGGPPDQSMAGQLAEQAKGESQQAAGQVGSGLGSSTKGPELGAKEGSVSIPSLEGNKPGADADAEGSEAEGGDSDGDGDGDGGGGGDGVR